jgi:hypothetical protein
VTDTTGILSEPICLSETLEPVPRWCFQQGTSSRWHPSEPPRCGGGVQSHLETLYNCPTPFKELKICGEKFNGSICILITGPEAWSPVSLQHANSASILDLENTSLKAVVTVLHRHHIPSVWLPARRDQPFGPLINKLPGKRWGTRFQNISSYSLVKISKSWSLHNNCVSLNIDNLVVETNNCSTKLPTVWVKIIPTQLQLLEVSCPKEYYVAKHDVGNSNRCFKIYDNLTYPVTWTKASEVCQKKRNGHLIKLSSPFDTNVFLEMAKRKKLHFGSKCWMGLKRKDGAMNGFVWSSELEEVGFVNWNSETAKDQSAMKFGTQGVVHADGTWSLLPDYSTLKCFVCEAAADVIDSELSVKFFPLSNKLLLRVYFPHGLWKEFTEDKGFQCFTDSAGNLIRSVETTEIWDKQWTIDDIEMLNRMRRKGGKSNLSFHVHKKIYELEYDKQSSGNYWCEGHKLSDFGHIKSNTVLVIGQVSGRIYSLTLDVHGNCRHGKDMKSCDPTFSDVLEKKALDLMGQISQFNVVSLRAMRLINIFNNGTLRILFHIQSPQNKKTTLQDWFYYELKVNQIQLQRQPGGTSRSRNSR